MSQETALQRHRQDYSDYLPLTERLQEDLRADVDILRAQEGWDQGTVLGVEEWVGDRGGIWRAFRRHRYDPDKALGALLSTLTYRISLSLHSPIPLSSPYANSPLFYILPLPRFTTRSGQPIVIITLKYVQRDASGSLGEMKEWTWWALEVVRRVLKDWWIEGQFECHSHVSTGENTADRSSSRGYGGEGCVLLVDAAGAGYRNLEVELLPTLFSVGHNHFPGVFDSVHVVNTGWAQRSMWTVVKRMLPKSALDKVSFLDDRAALETIFDLEKLPKCFGGLANWSFSPEANEVFSHYSRHVAPRMRPGNSSPVSPLTAVLPLRSVSTSSLADVFYTAQNTPASSRYASRRGSFSAQPHSGGIMGQDLRMTCMDLRRVKSSGTASHRERVAAQDIAPPPPDAGQEERLRSPSSEGEGEMPGPSRPRRPYHRRPSAVVSPVLTPLQRIKSLSDFHLYLSPSRLANLDLLSDSSDSENDASPAMLPPLIAEPTARRRLSLRPIIADPEATIRAQSIASRRSRPPLRLLGAGVAGEVDGRDNVRSYSDRLSLHHAHALRAYTKSPDADENQHVGKHQESPTGAEKAPLASHPTSNTSDAELPAEAPSLPHSLPAQTDSPMKDGPSQIQAVSAYSRSTNPWFGYPAVRLSSPPGSGEPAGRIIPLYPRNRKRDLVKTLLFLFMLRLQTLRDTLERKLGLHHLGNVPWSSAWREASGPSEGLKMISRSGKSGRWGVGAHRARWRERGEWIWMIIGFVLFRGTWAKVLATISAPLGALGLGGARDVLGLG